MPFEVDRPDPDALLTPSEVASLFHVSTKTIARWAEAGRLPSVRTLGGHRRFPVAPVRALLEEEGPRPIPPASGWGGSAGRR